MISKFMADQNIFCPTLKLFTVFFNYMMLNSRETRSFYYFDSDRTEVMLKAESAQQKVTGS